MTAPLAYRRCRAPQTRAHMASDHWVEILRCPQCRGTGIAALSEGETALEDRADTVPAGFKVLQSPHGIRFYCIACNVAAEP